MHTHLFKRHLSSGETKFTWLT